MSIPFSVFATIVSRAAAGTSGLSAMRSLKPVASDASSTAPMIAVPSEDPRFWAVPWSPPASLVFVGRDGGHDHVPELRGEQAGARADEGERDLEAGVVQLHVERREHHDRADADRDQPELRDGARRAPAGDPRAQQREDEHRHRQREQALAGLERVEAQHDLQVHGDDEERAHQDELLPEQRREPGAQLRDPQQRRVEQLVAAEAGATLLPHDERPRAARGRRAP